MEKASEELHGLHNAELSNAADKNEKLHNLYYLPEIVRVVKFGRLTWLSNMVTTEKASQF